MIVSRGPGEPIYGIFIKHGIVASVVTNDEQYTVLGIKPGDNINSLPDTINTGRISAVRNKQSQLFCEYDFELNGLSGRTSATTMDENGNIEMGFSADLIQTLKDLDPAMYNALREAFPTDQGWGEITEKDFSYYDSSGMPENLFNMDFDHACNSIDGHMSGDNVNCREFHISSNQTLSAVILYVSEEGKIVCIFILQQTQGRNYT